MKSLLQLATLIALSLAAGTAIGWFGEPQAASSFEIRFVIGFLAAFVPSCIFWYNTRHVNRSGVPIVWRIARRALTYLAGFCAIVAMFVGLAFLRADDAQRARLTDDSALWLFAITFSFLLFASVVIGVIQEMRRPRK